MIDMHYENRKIIAFLKRLHKVMVIMLPLTLNTMIAVARPCT